jgi:hypothetical protein
MEIRIIYTLRANNLTTRCTQSLGPYVWVPYDKSLRGLNCSSTLGMKAWFHSDRPTVAVILGYLILPPTTTIE